MSTLQANALQQYAIVTANYWAFTLTDGALRMLVLLFFYQQGYSPFELALLFVLYEFFGIVTNLIGGWIGARMGLKLTMDVGLALQIGALLMLTINPEWLTVLYVMVAQAISGIAKDLNKMSAKSSIKSLASEASGALYRWVALLTGSKNALKGVGFFIGGFLLTAVGFENALYILAGLLSLALLVSLLFLDNRLGKAKKKAKFSELFSKSPAVNWLSAARFFLFGARDIWFVVALPVYLASVLEWSHAEIGAYLALWIIGYGFIQASAPKLTGIKGGDTQHRPTARTAMKLAFGLAVIPLVMGVLLDFDPKWILLIGLMVFAVAFALNSAVHSYLIVSFADADGTSKDVGFYYMANAGGRLAGTLLSGYVYQVGGMEACLFLAAAFVVVAGALAGRIGEPA